MIIEILSTNWANSQGKKIEYVPVGALEISNSQIIAYGLASMVLQDIIEGNIRRGNPAPSIENADDWDEVLPAALTNVAYITKKVVEVSSELNVSAIYDRISHTYTKK